jgi:TRAP-type C4-dicarboxylate transport system permease small subunit
MKKLLFVLFALMAAMTVIGLTVVISRSVSGEAEDVTEEPAT